MAKSIKLLLIESVETLGIVGDVVNVRTGYARNFLLPRNLATTPSDELIKSLAAKRADAEKEVARQRKVKEELIGKLQGVELELTKSCNDQGHLYGGITQQELAGALKEKGYTVSARDIRLTEAIKRIGSFEIHVKLASDLDANIKLTVKADRELELDRDAHRQDGKKKAEKEGAEGEAGAEGAEAKTGDRPERAERGERRDRRDREDRPERRRDAFMDKIANDKGEGKGSFAPRAASADAAPKGDDKPAKKAEKSDKGEKKSKSKKD